jgi:hypothetical protein
LYESIAYELQHGDLYDILVHRYPPSSFIQYQLENIMTRLLSAISVCLAASASAFAPVSDVAKSTQLNAVAPDKQIGVQAPVGFFE